jgi:hypothetical protein
VAIDAPTLQHAVHVAVVARSADVVHDLGAPVFDQCLADFRREHIEHFVPGNTLEFTRAARADALQWIQDALRIVDLVFRRRTLGAIASARTGVVRIALEFLDRPRLLIDVGDQTAGRFAVEARRRHQRVMPLDFFRPRSGVVLFPIVPLRHGRE